MIECVVNISEGSDYKILSDLARVTNRSLLDLHFDPYHNRSVLSLAGHHLIDDLKELSRYCLEHLDLSSHHGVHPRLGIIDVAPFIPKLQSTFEEAEELRQRFAEFLDSEIGVPSFYYGDERSLPYVRKHAFQDLSPDFGPSRPHPTLGASCLGVRPPMIAYNLTLDADIESVRRLAATIRSSDVRALAFKVGEFVQLSTNLINPSNYGPMDLYFDIRKAFKVIRGELVGIIDEEYLAKIPPKYRPTLDIFTEDTVQSRLKHGYESPLL